MSLVSTFTSLAVAPLRVGLAVADVAECGLGVTQRALVETDSGSRNGSGPVARLLGLDDAVEGANRLARELDHDAVIGQALRPNGLVDRLLRPGGLIDRLTADGGLLDRLIAEDGVVARASIPGGIVDKVIDEGGLIDRMITDDGALSLAIAPNGLADQLLASDGLIERTLRKDGLRDRPIAEDGLLDTLADEKEPLPEFVDVANSLTEPASGREVLAPVIVELRRAIIALSQLMESRSKVADQNPLPEPAVAS